MHKAKASAVGQAIVVVPHARRLHPRFATKVMLQPALRHRLLFRQSQASKWYSEYLADTIYKQTLSTTNTQNLQTNSEQQRLTLKRLHLHPQKLCPSSNAHVLRINLPAIGIGPPKLMYRPEQRRDPVAATQRASRRLRQ